MRRSRLKPMTYSMCCQRPSSPPRLPTFVLPATAPTAGSANGWTSWRERVGLEHRVAVDHDDDLVRAAAAIPVLSAAGLAAVGLADQPDAAAGASASTMSAVPSVEPSSTTTTSSSGIRWPRSERDGALDARRLVVRRDDHRDRRLEARGGS